MLHQRRNALGRALMALKTTLGTLRDRVGTSDPGLIRLTLALRGTLSVFLTASGSMLIAHLGGWPVPEFACGVTLSMMAPFLMRDLSPNFDTSAVQSHRARGRWRMM